jgi:anaerobic carbon-monoxide dehydrogenase catalytic subunit
MLRKAQADGVETAFDRAAGMKPCPIGAKSACCKHCAMGPCRLNSKDPYAKEGICGATIDTIQSRNFARMVASGTAAHSSHGRNMIIITTFTDSLLRCGIEFREWNPLSNILKLVALS